jgi:hypothetical protein
MFPLGHLTTSDCMENFAREKQEYSRLSGKTPRVQLENINLEDAATDDDSTITHHPGYSVLKHRAQSPLGIFRSPQKQVRVSNFQKKKRA